MEGFSTGAIGNEIGGLDFSNLDTSWLNSGVGADTLGSAGGGGFSLGSLPWGNITNVLGKLGAGIGTGVASYQAGQQPTYIPYTRWLGNGLAMTGIINNAQNRQNLLDQYQGAGQALGNLRGNTFGLFNKDKRSNEFEDDLNNTDNIYGWDNNIYGYTTSPVGNAINNYMRY